MLYFNNTLIVVCFSAMFHHKDIYAGFIRQLLTYKNLVNLLIGTVLQFWVLHERNSVLDPGHANPPFEGGGLSQRRVLV